MNLHSDKLDFWAHPSTVPSSEGCFPLNKVALYVTRRGQSFMSTWTADSLGDEPPHEIGAVFTPVWASECVHLRGRQKSTECSVTWRHRTWHRASAAVLWPRAFFGPVRQSCILFWKKQTDLIFEILHGSSITQHRQSVGKEWDHRNIQRWNENYHTPNKARGVQTQDSLSGG